MSEGRPTDGEAVLAVFARITNGIAPRTCSLSTTEVLRRLGEGWAPPRLAAAVDALGPRVAVSAGCLGLAPGEWEGLACYRGMGDE